MKKRVKFLLTGFILSLPFWYGVNFFQENLEKYFYAQISQPIQEIVLVEIPPRPQKSELNLQAKSAFSVKINRVGKEKVAFRKNVEKPLPIASLTKLMTALLVFENTPQDDYNFSKIITISKKAASQDDVPVYGNLKSGESLKVETLLELMLIYSSNDAAFSLSEVIGLENFVEKMNQKAKILGLENTYFINPTGLEPEDLSQVLNYSTGQDLVKLAQYILNNHPLIFEISLEKGPYLIENGISGLILPEDKTIIGGKTGYTDEAGGCMFLVLGDGKGNYFFNVILGTISPMTRVQEMQKLINWLSL